MKKTKWDLISDKEKEILARTPFGSRCTGCGEMLVTEADFAQHFLLRDPRYPNLGYCPVYVGQLRGNRVLPDACRTDGKEAVMSDVRVCIVCAVDLTDVMGCYVFVVDDGVMHRVPGLMCVIHGANLGNNISLRTYAELTQPCEESHVPGRRFRYQCIRIGCHTIHRDAYGREWGGKS